MAEERDLQEWLKDLKRRAEHEKRRGSGTPSRPARVYRLPPETARQRHKSLEDYGRAAAAPVAPKMPPGQSVVPTAADVARRLLGEKKAREEERKRRLTLEAHAIAAREARERLERESAERERAEEKRVDQERLAAEEALRRASTRVKNVPRVGAKAPLTPVATLSGGNPLNNLRRNTALLREAMVALEILGPPIALRPRNAPWDAD
ncbi:MAG: hypothetical protein V1918_06090 [Planctomycetota bacterium]